MSHFKRNRMFLVCIMLFVVSLYGCLRVATHVSSDYYWRVSENDPVDRIYSGKGETVLITIWVYYSYDTPVSYVEILVNGVSIPDGEIKADVLSSSTDHVYRSRTFKLLKVKTIDIKLNKGGRTLGHYSISASMN